MIRTQRHEKARCEFLPDGRGKGAPVPPPGDCGCWIATRGTPQSHVLTRHGGNVRHGTHKGRAYRRSGHISEWRVTSYVEGGWAAGAKTHRRH